LNAPPLRRTLAGRVLGIGRTHTGESAYKKEDNLMNWDQLEKYWTEFAGSARAHWSNLTDEDWRTVAGNKGHLVARIQMRYGMAKEEAEKQVDKWASALQDIVRASKAH